MNKERTADIVKKNEMTVDEITAFLAIASKVSNTFRIFFYTDRKNILDVRETKIAQIVAADNSGFPVAVRLRTGHFLRKSSDRWTFYPRGNELGRKVVRVEPIAIDKE